MAATGKACSWWAGCLVIVGAGVLLLVGKVAWFQMAVTWKFSPLAWRLAPETGREAMARDYISSRELRGMSRSQILSDLGEPNHSSDYWLFAVGPDGLGTAQPRGISIRYSGEPILQVWFDPEGRVGRCLAPRVPESVGRREFDSMVWKSLSRPERQSMALALSKGEHLHGASKQQVEELLGPPDHAEAHFDYYVAWKGYPDHVILAVRFDIADRVDDIELD